MVVIVVVGVLVVGVLVVGVLVVARGVFVWVVCRVLCLGGGEIWVCGIGNRVRAVDELLVS